MDKFLFLKYSLIFVQILTLISFTLYLSHVFEESLDNHKALEPNIDDYIDDNQLWESRMDGLVVFGFLLFLYCVITFGVYSVIEEKIGRILVFLILFVIWMIAFHSVIKIYGLTIPKKLLVIFEIICTSLTIIFLLMLKRLDNLMSVRVNEFSKSVSTISDNLPYNPNFIV